MPKRRREESDEEFEAESSAETDDSICEEVELHMEEVEETLSAPCVFRPPKPGAAEMEEVQPEFEWCRERLDSCLHQIVADLNAPVFKDIARFLDTERGSQGTVPVAMCSTGLHVSFGTMLRDPLLSYLREHAAPLVVECPEESRKEPFPTHALSHIVAEAARKKKHKSGVVLVIDHIDQRCPQWLNRLIHAAGSVSSLSVRLLLIGTSPASRLTSYILEPPAARLLLGAAFKLEPALAQTNAVLKEILTSGAIGFQISAHTMQKLMVEFQRQSLSISGFLRAISFLQLQHLEQGHGSIWLRFLQAKESESAFTLTSNETELLHSVPSADNNDPLQQLEALHSAWRSWNKSIRIVGACIEVLDPAITTSWSELYYMITSGDKVTGYAEAIVTCSESVLLRFLDTWSVQVTGTEHEKKWVPAMATLRQEAEAAIKASRKVPMMDMEAPTRLMNRAQGRKFLKKTLDQMDVLGAFRRKLKESFLSFYASLTVCLDQLPLHELLLLDEVEGLDGIMGMDVHGILSRGLKHPQHYVPGCAPNITDLHVAYTTFKDAPWSLNLGAWYRDFEAVLGNERDQMSTKARFVHALKEMALLGLVKRKPHRKDYVEKLSIHF